MWHYRATIPDVLAIPLPTQAGALLLAAGAFVFAYMLAYRWIPPAVTKTLVFE
ncbi:MAG TPA: hypothetical protein VKT83_03790 [bacterium]|nr:hypothetical protein [bacterium]